MNLDEYLFFTRAFRADAGNVASVIPTSHFAAQAMADECARDPREKHILEAGPGTGAVTAELVRALGPRDRLTLVELNPSLANYLRERFERDPEFSRVRDQVEILEMDVTRLDGAARFDYIVSAIPFSNLPPEIVGAILLRYRSLLKPGGVLSFIEYAYGRAARRLGATLLGRDDARAKAEAVERLVASQAEAYEFRRDTVLRNIPPAWVRHWRFDAASATAADSLLPREHAQRASVGALSFDTDAAPALAGLGALAWMLRKRAPGVALLAAAAAAGTAWMLRDPRRSVLADPDLICSACDGAVTAVDTLSDEVLGASQWLRITVERGVSSVRIDRAPAAGLVADVIHTPGNTVYTVITDSDNSRLAVAQCGHARLGSAESSVVNRCQVGDALARGEKIGLNRFGPRTQVFLPADRYASVVRVGDQVRAAETPIARRR